MGKKVLILGASGFLGKHVKEKFFSVGEYEVLSPPRSVLDLEEYEQTETYFAEQKPDIIINCSGLCGGVLENIQKPADFIFYNAITSLNAIRAASVLRPKKFVNISSACSYPDTSTDKSLKPENLWNGRPHETHAPYGLAKRFSCEAAQAFSRQYDLKAINLILANLYGPGDKFDNPAAHAIPSIISRTWDAKESGYDSVTIYGSPDVTREFLFVEDAADAIYTLSRQFCDSRPLNVGSGETATIAEIARRIKILVGFDGVPMFAQERLSGQTHRKLDLSGLSATGWKAQTTLSIGLGKTVKAYMETKSLCLR